MAYDGTRRAVVLFGGLSGATILGDTWTWNGSGWTHRQGLTANPPARQAGSMAYDEVNRRLILFGGLGQSGPLNDTWAWDGSAWQALHPAHSPSPREHAPAVYDSALGAIVLYGGMNPAATSPTPINDTWIWNGADWTQLQPGASPVGGGRPRLAFLAGANLIERFGDCLETWDRSLYAFDGRTWSPHPVSGTWPPALCLPSFAGDISRRQLLLFGGNRATGAPATPDTWSYDGSAWKKLAPAQRPPPRYDAPMVYDPDHRSMVLFGGQGLSEGQSGPLSDTWSWDGSNWTERQ
jgi:galactose oxidase-like protein